MLGINKIFTAVVLVFVCGFLLGCPPSELEEKKQLLDPDFVIQGGKLAFYFDEPRIEYGETYIASFTIDECDESFLGNRMGGKVSYEDVSAATGTIPAEGLIITPTNVSEAANIMAGWDYCIPNIILDRPMTYKWTFTAGQKQRDNKPILQDWTKVPDDAAQFFLLMPQTLNWKNFGSFTQFGIKGSITFAKKVMPTGTLTLESVITLDNSYITGAEYSKLTAIVAGDPYAFVRVYMKGCNLTASEIEERTGVAAIGNLDNIRSANPNAQVIVPAAETKRPEGAAEEDYSAEIPLKGGSGLNFYVDLDVADILMFRKSNESNLFVNVFTGRLDRIELYTYK